MRPVWGGRGGAPNTAEHRSTSLSKMASTRRCVQEDKPAGTQTGLATAIAETGVGWRRERHTASSLNRCLVEHFAGRTTKWWERVVHVRWLADFSATLFVVVCRGVCYAS